MRGLLANQCTRKPARKRAPLLDVLRCIRARRLKWVGHILRMCPDRMVYKALQHIHLHRKPGDLMMDVPAKYSWRELVLFAADRDAWRARVRKLRNGSIIEPKAVSPQIPPCSRSSPTIPIATTTSDATKTTTVAKLYPQRCAYEAFFRPKLQSSRKRRRVGGDLKVDLSRKNLSATQYH